MYRSTGIVAALAAERFRRAAEGRVGCFDPAELLGLNDLQAELTTAGIHVTYM
jgi:hypothetical protein